MLGALSSQRQFSATESPLKMMKNAYFKNLFVFSRYLNILFGHFGHAENNLIRIRLISSKFMMSQPG